MKFIVQRVHEASVTINHEETRSIGRGLLVYVGISEEGLPDRQQKVDKFASKVQHLKLFEDAHGKINASLQEVDGEMLLISNFTIHGRNHKGTQVDFSKAAKFADAKSIYEALVFALQQQGVKLQTGEFGAKYMDVASIVDGPVNVILEF